MSSVITHEGIPVITTDINYLPPFAFPSPAGTMSVQYTIDIQLTELGFPDVLLRQESLSTTCDDSQSPCPSPALTSPDPPRGSQHLKGQPSKQLKGQQARSSTWLQAGTGLRASPSQQIQSPQSEADAVGVANPLEVNGNKPAVPQQQQENSDSDDSDVSVVCHEDEEDYEDQDGLDNGKPCLWLVWLSC